MLYSICVYFFAINSIKYLSSTNKLKEVQLLRELEMHRNLLIETRLKDSLLQKEKQLHVALETENRFNASQLGSEKRVSALLHEESSSQKKQLQREYLLRGFLIIGLTAFWLEDTVGITLIYSRMTMILGGMLLPLELFPPVFKTALKMLPFGYIVSGPARLFVHPDPLAWTEAARLLSILFVADVFQSRFDGTPAICDGAIFLRSNEYLYCVGLK
jgi:hypothetical protein